MNGNTAGLEPTDSSRESDSVRRWRDALSAFNQAAKAAADVGEHQLQRLAEDAAARAIGWIESTLEEERRQLALQLSSLDGQDPKDARQGQKGQ